MSALEMASGSPEVQLLTCTGHISRGERGAADPEREQSDPKAELGRKRDLSVSRSAGAIGHKRPLTCMSLSF